MQKGEKFKENFWNTVFFLLLFTLAVVVLSLISMQGKKGDKAVVVGAVFVGPVDDAGWNESHFDGLSHACEEMNMPLHIVENVPEEPADCQVAVDELVAQGCRVIFLTSDGYGSNMTPVVESHPDIVFYTVSPEADADNTITYYGRMYQVRYMAGVIAGEMTKTNVLGFVAAMNTPQVKRDINSFLLGARSVNPHARIKVRMTGMWTEEAGERKAAEDLIDKDGADILAYHTSTEETVRVAEERGVYSFGFNYLAAGHSDKFLAAVVFHWGVLYRAILQDYMRGNVDSTQCYWWGVTEGAVEIEGFSPLVDKGTYAKIKNIRDSFARGQDVFMGRIVRNDGKVMCRKDERMSDESLLKDMKWYVEGVEVDVD